MAIIYLVRHAQSEMNALKRFGASGEYPLTAKGILQAKRLGQFIKRKKLKFDEVLVSPLTRTLETCEIALKEAGIKVKPKLVETLVERNQGFAEGMKMAEVEENYPKQILKTKFGIFLLKGPKVETFSMLKKRVGKVLKAIQKEYRGKKVLVVAHGDVGIMICCLFYKLDWKKTLQTFHFKNSDLLLLERGRSFKRARIYSGMK